MDGHRFDDLARSLTGSRRSLRAGLLLTPPLWLGALDGGARRKGKDTPRKPKPNQYGCLDVGDPCQRARQCCSSICEGQRGKMTCRAHDEGVCTPRRNACVNGGVTICNPDNPKSACVLTTGKAAFCADSARSDLPDPCQRCSRDADCQNVFGPGAACVDMRGDFCHHCDHSGRRGCFPSALRQAAEHSPGAP
jgi:hypothetical protein